MTIAKWVRTKSADTGRERMPSQTLRPQWAVSAASSGVLGESSWASSIAQAEGRQSGGRDSHKDADDSDRHGDIVEEPIPRIPKESLSRISSITLSETRGNPLVPTTAFAVFSPSIDSAPDANG